MDLLVKGEDVRVPVLSYDSFRGQPPESEDRSVAGPTLVVSERGVDQAGGK